MNGNDVLFQKVTQAYLCMPVSLSGIIHHSHSFTRLKIYHHAYFKDVSIVSISNLHMVLTGYCIILMSQAL